MNPRKAVLRLQPDGTVRCLHTDLIDLRVLGRLHVERATRIVFDAESQSWRVLSARTGEKLFDHPSREACLVWERENLPPAPGPDFPVHPP